MQDNEAHTHCPRCKREFECKPGDISSCHCSAVKLSTEEYNYINSRFQECLCNGCLDELKKEYMLAATYNKSDASRRFLPFIFFLCSIFFNAALAQNYPPPVGQAGSTAIDGDSTIFINWSTGCNVTRGYQDITTPSLGLASVGDNSMATGKAGINGVVSLGDGGIAICTFENPIRNGSGYDFAVFENGFDDLFLELAFVEVSSDGQHYFRFPSHSLTDTTTQTGSFGTTDATKINNLAGKYRGGYGTPFDLQELAGKPGLDIDNITHVKIIDVIGNLDPAYATRDSHGNKVNDPWPTAFPSGGFDLDAVGVLYENKITGIKQQSAGVTRIYPNPLSSGSALHIQSEQPVDRMEIIDQMGRVVQSGLQEEIKTASLETGLYVLKMYTSTGLITHKLLVSEGAN